MGRGGYLGGGTIVQAGSNWFSGHVKRQRPVVDTPCSPEALAFLKLVVSARRIVPDVPRTMSPELAKEIEWAGGPFEWAKTRREYSSLRPGKSSATAQKRSGALKVGTRSKKRELDQAAAEARLKAPIQLRGDDGPPAKPTAKQSSTRSPSSSKPTLTDQARLNYLTALVAGMVREKTLPKPPRDEPGRWAADIVFSASLEDWARAQPEFAAVETTMKKRLEKERSRGQL